MQKRIQRYGWDLAAQDYEPMWRAQLAAGQEALLSAAGLQAGEDVLDVACGTGLVTFSAAWEVGRSGRVLGVDISERMIETARGEAAVRGVENVSFARMDAEALDVPDASFDVVLCALGLMYFPEPERAVREMRRVLRPGGRLVAAVWGERAHCGWSPVFPIVDAEVKSDVCPLFFRLGEGQTLAQVCERAGFSAVSHRRLTSTLDYADGETACDAAFVGGPVALAWSRFDADARARVRAQYLDAIDSWRGPDGYALPGEFVVVAAGAPA